METGNHSFIKTDPNFGQKMNIVRLFNIDFADFDMFDVQFRMDFSQWCLSSALIFRAIIIFYYKVIMGHESCCA